MRGWGLMDDLTPEDWAKYGGGYGYGEVKRVGLLDEKDKEDEDDYSMSLSSKPSRSKSDFVVKKRNKTVTFSQYEDDKDDDLIQTEIEPKQSNIDQLLLDVGGSTGYNAPIQSRIDNKKIIPYDIQHSAYLLLEAHQQQDIRLPRETLSSIKKLAECNDEFTQIDPMVVIFDTFSTGTCKIHVKEVVPISVLLLARHFNLTYSVRITDEMESNPRPFKGVKVKPYHGKSTQHIQSLGCQAMVNAYMKRAEQWKLVEIYMLRMGAQSSVTLAGDEDWLEMQTKAIGKVLNKQAPNQRPEGEKLIGSLDQ